MKKESFWGALTRFIGAPFRAVKKFFHYLAEDKRNFDINNTSEQKALYSHFFSAYRRRPVLRIYGRRSGSFGVIFLTRESAKRKDPEDEVRHEYGHTIQLRQMGVLKYLIRIGLPSWTSKAPGPYYDRPWEVTADLYGGVRSRVHKKEIVDAGIAYLDKYKKRRSRKIDFDIDNASIM